MGAEAQAPWAGGGGDGRHTGRERKAALCCLGQGGTRGSPWVGLPSAPGQEGQRRAAGCVAGLPPASAGGGCCSEF